MIKIQQQSPVDARHDDHSTNGHDLDDDDRDGARDGARAGDAAAMRREQRGRGRSLHGARRGREGGRGRDGLKQADGV